MENNIFHKALPSTVSFHQALFIYLANHSVFFSIIYIYVILIINNTIFFFYFNFNVKF